MSKQPDRHDHREARHIDSIDVSMPNREAMLIEILRNSSLKWQSSRTHEHRSWLRGGSDPICPQLELLTENGMSAHEGSSSSSLGASVRNSCTDWRTIEKETLRAETEDYQIFFSKTIVRAFSARFGESTNSCWHTAHFVNRLDHERVLALDEGHFQTLGSMFDELSNQMRESL